MHSEPVVPINPFAAASGRVRAEGGHACAGRGMDRRKDRIAGKVRFSLAREWVFVAGDHTVPDEGEPEVTGTLHVFLPEGPLSLTGPAMVDELARTVPDAAQALARRIKDMTPVEAPPPTPQPPGGPEDDLTGWTPPGRANRTTPDSAAEQSAPPWPSSGNSPAGGGLTAPPEDEWRPPPRP
jgi:hypothetical protein